MRYCCTSRRQRPLILFVVTVTCAISTVTSAGEGETVYECDFDSVTQGLPPEGWTSFTPSTEPDVAVTEAGVLRGVRSRHPDIPLVSFVRFHLVAA